MVIRPRLGVNLTALRQDVDEDLLDAQRIGHDRRQLGRTEIDDAMSFSLALARMMYRQPSQRFLEDQRLGIDR